MSDINIIKRAGRDMEPQPEQSGFQLPPELTKRYEVRIIPGNDEAQRRIGLFLPGDRENPSIEISGSGDRIVARREDPETVAALVQIAKHNGWEGIDVDGSPEFRKAVWTAGTREGLTVRGYEPEFGEQARMDGLRREDAARRERETVAKTPAAEPTGPPVATTVAVSMAVGSADAERARGETEAREAGGAGLSSNDRRLAPEAPEPARFMVEHWDVKTRTNVVVGETNSPSEAVRLFKSQVDTRIIDQQEGRTVASTEWVNDGSFPRWNIQSAMTALVERETSGKETAPELLRPSEVEPVQRDVEGQSSARTTGRSESEHLAELFLHGGAEQISAEPRLANAREAQAMMERHLQKVFDGDIWQTTAATLESRQIISDVLRRGLDVSVREPTPVRQIEPPQPTPDLER